ncbi:hypothetical protein AAZF84_24935 [Bacillus sp. JR_15]
MKTWALKLLSHVQRVPAAKRSAACQQCADWLSPGIFDGKKCPRFSNDGRTDQE